MNQHPSYRRLVELAERSHQAGRNILGISRADIDLARLYAHAFRGHVIGAFHATRVALEAVPSPNHQRQRAIETLTDLADLAMDPILADGRALVSTFLRYHRGISRMLDALQDESVRVIAKRFRKSMEGITASNGIVLTQDTHAPEQASFVVPNLGITIVPLVYGDHHSWNLAWLGGPKSDVPFHRHHEGVEIHLGYSPIHGETVLGDCRALVREGYAMPIPPMTTHGYVHHGDQVHHVPFVYGSLKAGGWGVFLDVEPQPKPPEQLKAVSIDAPEMNGSIHLEREIEKAAKWQEPRRGILIAADRTNRGGCGGLELGVIRVTKVDMPLPIESFRTMSVVWGSGEVEMNGIRQAIQAHDHFGIPAGMSATLRQHGDPPLVLLDSVLRA